MNEMITCSFPPGKQQKGTCFETALLRLLKHCILGLCNDLKKKFSAVPIPTFTSFHNLQVHILMIPGKNLLLSRKVVLRITIFDQVFKSKKCRSRGNTRFILKKDHKPHC